MQDSFGLCKGLSAHLNENFVDAQIYRVYLMFDNRSLEAEMTDTALENACKTRHELREKIAEANKQISEWEAKIERVERFIRDWHEFSGEDAPLRFGKDNDSHDRRQSASARNPKKEEVAAKAAEIIRGHGRPLDRSELIAELEAAGVSIHGTRPAVVLQTMLWRTRDVVVHLKGYGYWPADRPFEPAGYDPSKQPREEDLDENAKALI